MDNNSVIEQIKGIIRIEDVVSEHVMLQPAGRRLKARCPFHEEKTPSFYVSPDLGLYKCFGCGVGGDIFDFLMRIERLTFPEAGERLAERAGLQWSIQPGDEARAKRRQLVRRANEMAVEYFENLLWSPAGAHALKYTRERGFTDDTIRRFRLGYSAEAWDGLLRHLRQKGVDDSIAAEAGLAKERPSGGFYDAFRHRVMFPIIDVGGHVIAFGGRALDPEDSAKYINTSDTPMFKKGRHVYALNLAHLVISRASQVVVVEGYTDVLALHQAGIENVVACLGTALTEDHLRLLSRYAEEIVLAYDADAAGMNAAARNIPMLEACPADVRIVLLPEGLDPDECVKTQGAEGFLRVLENRRSPVEYEIDLIFAQHASRGPDGMGQAAQKVVDVISRVPDRSRQDDFLARAADHWGSGSPGRTAAMQAALKEELRRRKSGQSAPKQTGAVSPRDRRFIVEGVSRLAAEVPPWVARAEREILGFVLSSRDAAHQVAGELPADRFAIPAHRRIAQAAMAQLDSDETYEAKRVIEQVNGDEEAYELAVELAFEDGGATPQEVIHDLIAKLKRYSGSGGQRTTYEVGLADDTEAPAPVEDFEELRKRVAEKLNSGSYDPDDPDIQLFMAHSARARGNGNAGTSA